MVATTYCAEAELVGKAAYRMYRDLGCHVVVSGMEPLRGVISYGRGACTVRRIGLRSWEVWSDDRIYVMDSQWELLAWIGDRL